jgi:uncharacterized protein YndB with AHSA1/START domain
MESIQNEVRIAAPAAQVYRALSTTEGHRAWWTSDCELGSRLGERAVFRFDRPQGSPPGLMEVTFRIDALEAGRRVALTCVANQNNPEWQDTALTFRLEEQDGTTRVALDHAGFRARTPLYEMCVGGWAHFMGSLKSYVETGVGQPHLRKAAAA